MTQAPFITLENITVRLRDRWFLEGTTWPIRRGQNWAVWGPNGAGKTTLARVLMGEVAVVKGWVRRHYEQDPSLCNDRKAVAMVSSEQYHHLYQQDRFRDDMRHFSGRQAETTAAGELLKSGPEGAGRDSSGQHWQHVASALDLPSIVSKPLNALSSGEMRKLLIARALIALPCLLILDEPFNGLDAQAQRQLNQLMTHLAAQDMQMVLIAHRPAEIPSFFSHVLQVDHGRVVWQGSRKAFDPPSGRVHARKEENSVSDHHRPVDQRNSDEPLIDMREVSVRFGDQVVLDRINWTVRPGENWALIGPNGAGKSTLLKLITGDQLQAYANRIFLFGRRRGSGETVWQIKQHIGYVGDELQARYQQNISGLDVVASGFFDSVGLFRLCSDAQRTFARQWVERLALEDLAEQRMARLSFGQQRLLLIARAMVKSPRLLILDEPCNGLDVDHRRHVLALLEKIGRSGTTHLLYVSHRPDEIPDCITRRLFLQGGVIIGQSGG